MSNPLIATCWLHERGDKYIDTRRNIEALIADGGDITLGAVYPIERAATAAEGHNSVAMLVRRKGETLNALLKRLDKAIAKFYDDGKTIDEINSI